jgi:hypothetical protein
MGQRVIEWEGEKVRDRKAQSSRRQAGKIEGEKIRRSGLRIEGLGKTDGRGKIASLGR